MKYLCRPVVAILLVMGCLTVKSQTTFKQGVENFTKKEITKYYFSLDKKEEERVNWAADTIRQTIVSVFLPSDADAAMEHERTPAQATAVRAMLGKDQPVLLVNQQQVPTTKGLEEYHRNLMPDYLYAFTCKGKSYVVLGLSILSFSSIQFSVNVLCQLDSRGHVVTSSSFETKGSLTAKDLAHLPIPAVR